MEIEKFTQSVSYLLNKVSTVYYSNLEKALSKIGLHYGQIYVLVSLWETDNQTQKELADQLSVSPPTINKMVKSLALNGFVNLNRCEYDSRAVRVSLSENGRSIREQVEDIWKITDADICSGLNETEKLILFQILQKMK